MISVVAAILLTPVAGVAPYPLNDLAEIFAGSYPAEAREAGEEGNVTIVVRVAENGRVSDCKVVSSSGSTILDTETCKIAREKATFSPARDASGEAVPDYFKFQTNWVLPPIPIVASTDRLIFTLDRGTVVECHAIGTTDTVTSCDAPSPTILARTFGERFIDIKKLETIQTIKPGYARVPRTNTKGIRVTIGEALVSLAKDGRVASCSTRSPPETTQKNICAIYSAPGLRFSGARAFVVAFDLVADLAPSPSPKVGRPK